MTFQDRFALKLTYKNNFNNDRKTQVNDRLMVLRFAEIGGGRIIVVFHS